MVVCFSRFAKLSDGRAGMCTQAPVGQREINANKNPEFLVSPPGQLLVPACTDDRSGDFAFLCYYCNR